jgi:cytoskeletal protein CcmA (bactofilin family)
MSAGHSVSHVETVGPEGAFAGDITVKDHLVVRSSVYGKVVVPPGTLLEIFGMVNGGVTVESGGRAFIYGTCNQGLTNKGDIQVYGTINGGIRGRGRTLVSEGALIDGVRGLLTSWERTPLPNQEVWGGQHHNVNLGSDGKVSVVGAELIDTHLVVDRQFVLQGAATEGVHVLADGRLHVGGAVVGGITVDPGGHATIQGMCVGEIINNGEVDVTGVVQGKVSGSGTTRVAPNAIVDGIKGSDMRGS